MKKLNSHNGKSRRAVLGYEQSISDFEKTSKNSLEGIANGIIKDIIDIEAGEGMSVPVEKDAKVLKDIMGGDIRDNVPPQIYSIISEIVGIVEEIEED